jgi:hypothetical protein
LLRHKSHVARAIVKASEKREESIGESVRVRLEKLYQRADKVLSDAETSGDGRLALAAIREARETQGTLFALALKVAEAGGGPLAHCTSDQLKDELDRRGEPFEIRIRHMVLGQLQTHEWEALPESWNALLPGKPKGKLYIVRELVRDNKACPPL